MANYLEKEEVYTILQGAQRNATMDGKQEVADAIGELAKKIMMLYSIRPDVKSSWKTICGNRAAIYCAKCGFKTLAYKNTPYCPSCGKSMLNGVRRNDAGRL